MSPPSSVRPLPDERDDEIVTARVPKGPVRTHRIDPAFGRGRGAMPRVRGAASRSATAKWPPGSPGPTARLGELSPPPAPAAPPPSTARVGDPPRSRPTLASPLSAWAPSEPLTHLDLAPSASGEDVDDLEVTATFAPAAVRYLAELGGGGARLRSRVPSHELSGSCDDPNEAFVLSLLDGHTATTEVVEQSGLAEVEVLRLLMELVDRGLIEGVPEDG